MESKNPFDAVRSMMEDNLAKVGSATKSYLDLMQKSMLSVPNANEDQINAFRAYIERQVAANQAFVGKPVRAKVLAHSVTHQHRAGSERYSRGSANSGRVLPVSNEKFGQ